MKLVFMGTPAFAAVVFDALAKNHDIAAVFTQPDRPSGRGHKLAESPVKQRAAALGIPIFQPKTLKLSDPEAAETRKKLAALDADIFVVAAYGLLLPTGVLNMPAKGCINVHASLLPAYRGASPIHSAILNGDAETGITIMHMAAEMDTGDIILQKRLAIAQDETFPQLHDRMATLGAEAILEALSQVENGSATRTPQDNALATYSPQLKKSDGEINPADSSRKILNQIRALNPWPGCFIEYNGQPLKIWHAARGGRGEGIPLKTADGTIELLEVQPPGKKRMPAADFLRGQKG